MNELRDQIAKVLDDAEGSDMRPHRAYELADAVLAEVDVVPCNWWGLMMILDKVYPEKAFPTTPGEDRVDRDLGPRIISLLRDLNRLPKLLGQ